MTTQEMPAEALVLLDEPAERPATPVVEAPRPPDEGGYLRLPLPTRTNGFASWSRRYVAALVLLDGLIGLLTVLATVHLYPPASLFSPDKQVALVLGAGIAWPLVVGLCQGYDWRRIGVGDDELRAVLRAVVLSIAVAAVPSAAVDKYGLVALSVVAVPIAGLLTLLLRFVGRRYTHRQQRHGRHVRRVLLVGSHRSVVDLQGALSVDHHHGMVVVGVCVPEPEVARAQASGLRVLGHTEDVVSVLRATDLDAVAVAGGDATGHQYLRRLSWSLEGAGVELLVHPGLVEVAGPRMHIRPYVGLPLLHVEQPHFSGWRRLVKRATDLVLTVLGLVVIAPLLAAIALAIKLEDRGPVFFSQPRVGLDGSVFRMWKFRSMHTDAEARLAELRRQNPGIGLMFKMADDPRVTRVGRLLRRFSLDELPQLFNVLEGSMSLVGPRPPLQSEVDVYEHHARRRLLVTPGLTGLWQVSGRSLLSWEETVRLDLRYVENWTLTLDLLILWKTFFAVLGRRGAF
jgi:exopolysaccharide biosynthesis polyprenyl glycosylphosphotransferase